MRLSDSKACTLSFDDADIRLNETARWFSCLKDWTLEVDRDSDYAGQMLVDTKNKVAYLYPWPPDSKEPWDFILHEVLHVVMTHYHSFDRRKIRKMRDLEESIVRDICMYIDHNFKPGEIV